MKLKYLLTAMSCSLLISINAHAQNDMKDVQITSTEVAEGLYMLQGRGGNIGLSVGSDGAFLIDDQFAPLTEKIKAKVAELSSGQPIRFVMNTHWHRDHTGGNENLGNDGVIIVAHDNVRERLLNGGEIEFFNAKVPPANAKALPVITFADSMTFHWNSETMKIQHVGPAHTDGDSVVYFEKANAVHMGDTYFNGFYPFIDGSNGGSVTGVVEVISDVLKNIDDNTKIIPGHGPLSNKAELTAYRDMLNAVADKISKMKAEGKTVEEVLAAKPTAEFEEKWGKGFIKAEPWVMLLYPML